MINFAIIGLGFISARHMRAIAECDGQVMCACDIDNTKKIKFIDASCAKDTFFTKSWFTDWREMMDSRAFKIVDYCVICTPNDLHYEMVIGARAKGKKVICEKPFVLSLDELTMLADDTDINVLLQLRHAHNILKQKKHNGYNRVNMKIHVHRGDWYMDSWKVDIGRSGGLMWNIGVHYFDLLDREFGPLVVEEISPLDDVRMHGKLRGASTNIKWSLDISTPIDEQERSFSMNRTTSFDVTNFTYGLKDIQEDFADLHTRAYIEILRGVGSHPRSVFRVTNLLTEMTERARQEQKRSA